MNEEKIRTIGKLIEDIYNNANIIEELNKMTKRKHTRAESLKVIKINLSLSTIKESAKMIDSLTNVYNSSFVY